MKPPSDVSPAKPGAPIVSFAEAFRFWLKLGFISFGGPTGQIAILHSELVERKGWISEERFLHALNFCMLLPGPEATQLAIYIGWLLHGTRGGIVAGALFILPSIFILLGLSWIYVTYGNVLWVTAIFFGLKPAVMALVAHAVVRIGKKALRNKFLYAMAAISFVGIFFFKVPFPVIILTAGTIGWIGGRFWPDLFAFVVASPSPFNPPPHESTRPTIRRSLAVLLVCITLWWTPVVWLARWTGSESIFVREGIFFSKAAMVTFGGAYAVLPYVQQAAVEQYHWLNANQMMDGLGLAETTPGPLIMVVQFVGFLGGWNQPGGFPNWMSALIGALLTTWVTFVPCFLWIFLGAPYVERLRGNRQVSAALSTITAAVVGVVLNLALWFGWNTLRPASGGVNWFALAVGFVALAGLWRWKWEVVPVILGSGVLGFLWIWAQNM